MSNPKVEIIAANYNYTFQVYKSESVSHENLYMILKKDELSTDLEKMKPGFFKIEKYLGAIMAIFAYPLKEMIEVLREGVLSKLEVPVLETARVLFVPGYILFSGKSSPAKMALQILSPFVNISTSYLKADPEKMREILEQAAVIKSIQFRNIPHSEVDRITLAGELEDVYNFGSLPLREAEITHFTGVYNTPLGIRNLKFSQNGRIQIAKSKKSAITLELIDWVLKIFGGS
ncbi:MAG: hypothetical protein PHW04_02065 [Candidatus Wallbacteria bacterium]|nr:hypothetical protein [Candidatus Wallbacteria bacterium]